MKVLIVEPMTPCYVREISGLNDMQEIVGGHIEAISPFKEQVAIIAHEEGKILGLPFNRPLSDERGVPYDIVCGTFFLAGLGAEDFVSLTEEQIRRYKMCIRDRPAPDQLWPGQEVLPFIPVSGWKRYPFSLRGAGLHRHHPGAPGSSGRRQ